MGLAVGQFTSDTDNKYGPVFLCNFMFPAPWDSDRDNVPVVLLHE